MSSNEAVYSGVRDAFCYADQMIRDEACNISCELTRPSRTMRPRVFKDGDSWCALYGESPQDGVAGFGNTPELACQNFDEAWHGRE